MDVQLFLDSVEGDRAKHMRLLGYPAAQTATRLHLDSKIVRKAFAELAALDGIDKTKAKRDMIWRGLNVVYAQALDLAYNPAYLFHNGRIVTSPRFLSDGSMLMDDDGNPVQYPVIDRAMQIKGMQLLLQVLKQMSDFDGLGAPSKLAMTDPTGKKPGNPVSFYQIEMPSNGRDNALPNAG
jgi:hypothetical protein